MRKYWKFVGIGSAQLFAGSMVLAVLAVYFDSLGFSESWISVVFGIFPIVMFLTSTLSGELGDEIGRSWLIRVALVLTALSYSLYLLGSATSIIVGRVLDAVSFAALSILVLAKIEDLLSDQTRGRYTGIFYSIRDGVRVLAPLIGGYLADQWIGLPFITAIVVLILTAFALRTSLFHKKTTGFSFHPMEDIRWFVSQKKLRPLVVLGPLTNGMLPLINVFLPLLVVHNLGLSYTAVGAATSAYIVGHITQFFFGDLGDKLGAQWVMLYGTLIMSVCAVLVPILATTYPRLLVLFFVYGTGTAAWNVCCVEWLSEIAEREDKQGTAMGSYITIAKVGEGAAYLISGAVVAWLGSSAIFFLLGGLCFVGVLVAGWMFAALAHAE